MSREDLPVIALCLSLAATLTMGAIRQADWKHKSLIRFLLALAGLLVAFAAGWPWIKDGLPWIGPAVDWLGLGGFSGGAFSVLAVWGCFEISHAVRRGRKARRSALVAAVPPPTERIFLPTSTTVIDLTKPFQEHADIDAANIVSRFVGKWMKVTGLVRNISRPVDGRVLVSCQPDLFTVGSGVWLVFGGTNRDVALSLNKGAAISAIGRIQHISHFGVWLEYCELQERFAADLD